MLERIFPLLTASDIEVKVKKVSKAGALALLYKTARVDMKMLDDKFGAMGWQDKYEEIKGNLYCFIGVWNDKINDFVWKGDCGIESREDEEGNQKKGEASDAFKRAGFKWGIGRELYTAPTLWLNVETEPDGKKYQLKDKYATFHCEKIEYNVNDEIMKVVISDNKGNVVFPKSHTKPSQPHEVPRRPEGDPNTVIKTGVHEGKKLVDCPLDFLESMLVIKGATEFQKKSVQRAIDIIKEHTLSEKKSELPVNTEGAPF